MQDFAGRIAVVTGGGTGMGRELVRQLVAEGRSVAMCDVFTHTMAETKQLCEAARLPQGLRITTHIADVSDEAQVEAAASACAGIPFRWTQTQTLDRENYWFRARVAETA